MGICKHGESEILDIFTKKHLNNIVQNIQRTALMKQSITINHLFNHSKVTYVHLFQKYNYEPSL